MELVLKKNSKEIANGPLSKIIMDYMLNYDALTLARIVYENTNAVTGKVRSENIISSFLFFIAKWPLLDLTERLIVAAELQNFSDADWSGDIANFPFWFNPTGKKIDEDWEIDSNIDYQIIDYLNKLSNLDIEVIECN